MARGKRAAAPPAIKVRDMRPRDVPQVVAIENATSATPWTRAMFLSELGRPGTLDLVADQGGDVLAYIMVSRYADVWHILNLCVRAPQRGQGLGGRMLDELFARAGGQVPPRVHAGGARIERPGDPPLPPQGVPRARRAPRLLLRQRRGRDHHVARRRTGGERVLTDGPDPRDRDLLRRDRRRRGDAAARSSPAWSPRRPTCTRPTAAWCPRSRRATTSGRSTRSSTARSRRPRSASTTSRWWPSPSGPGLIGALLVGVSTAKALAYARGQAPGDGQPPARPHRRRLAGAGRPRPALRQPDRLGRPHAPGPRDGLPGAAPLGQTIDDAAGEAIDKGARLLGLGYPGARRSSASPATATARHTASRWGWTGAGRATSPSPA